MKILIADDSKVYRKAITASLKKWGHDVVQASDGDEALALLRAPDAPSLAILDWMMPGINGTDICRAIRRDENGLFKYILLLTSRETKEDIAAGLESGADDYVVKPFDNQELEMRVKSGERIVRLEQSNRERIDELEQALENVERLQGIIPICAWCNSIRDDKDYWLKVEDYLEAHSKTQFTHAICPACAEKQLAEIS
jgi:DNA-binding response OmpR family regulator